jgi:hypothetical protein
MKKLYVLLFSLALVGTANARGASPTPTAVPSATPTVVSDGCNLTIPVILSWTIDDYYTISQWPTFNLTMIGPNPFINPNEEPIQNFLWAYSVHTDGTRVTVDLNAPNSSGVAQPWTFVQKQLANGCWEAVYNDVPSLTDEPETPSYCEPNPRFPKLCVGRGVEKSGWQVTDSANRTSILTDGSDCVTEGPPVNPGGNRGALCQQ